MCLDFPLMVNPGFDSLLVDQRRLMMRYALVGVVILEEQARSMATYAERVHQKTSDNTHTSSKYLNVSINTLLPSKPHFMCGFLLGWLAECANSLSQDGIPSRSVNYGAYKLEDNPIDGVSRFSPACA